MSLKIVVLSSRLEQLMISPEESCFLRFLSFFFFFLSCYKFQPVLVGTPT